MTITQGTTLFAAGRGAWELRCDCGEHTPLYDPISPTDTFQCGRCGRWWAIRGEQVECHEDGVDEREICKFCGGVSEHQIGCPEMDKPR